MKHYRIVKKSTHLLIAISAVALFFNLALFGATTLGLLEVSKPEKTIAVDVNPCVGNNVNVRLNDVSKDKEINKFFDIIFESSDNPAKMYKITYYIEDVATGKVGYIGDESAPTAISDVSSGKFDRSSLSISGTGPKQIYAKYNLQLPGLEWCTSFIKTNTIDINGVNYAQNSANIDLTAPEKTDQGISVPITGTIRGANGKKYALYIDKGGACSDKSEDETCWSQKQGGGITTDPFTFSYEWPTAGSTLGRHAIVIKVFGSILGEMTDKKTIHTTICNPGTANTICVADNSDDKTNGGVADDPITTPKSIDKFSTFSSPFTMPTNINGAGDLVQFIIVILEELLGAFAFFGIVVSGIQYISSGGDSAKAEKAKKNLIYCVIGIVIAVLALSLQSIIARFWAGPS